MTIDFNDFMLPHDPQRLYWLEVVNDYITKLDAEEAENKKLRELLNECYTALAYMADRPSATVPRGLGPRILEALK